MNKDILNEIYTFLQEKDYLDAYNEITNQLEKYPKDFDLIYLHAVVDFLFLKENDSQSFDEFLTLVKNKKKHYKDAIQFLVVMADHLNDIDIIFTYGKEALKIAQNGGDEYDLTENLYFILAYNFSVFGNEIEKNEGYQYIKQLFEEFPDDIGLEHYTLKFEIELNLVLFAEARNTLEEQEKSLGTGGELFFNKARLKFAVKEFDEAAKNLELAEKYDYDQLKLIKLKSRIMIENKEYARLIDDLKKLQKDEKTYEVATNLLIEVYLNDDVHNLFNALLLIHHAKKKLNKYSLEYLEISIISENFLNQNKPNITRRINYCVSLYADCLKVYKISEVLYDLVILLVNNNRYQEAYEYLVNIPFDDGKYYYLLAGCKAYLGFDFDDIVNDFKKSYELGFISELEYIDEVEYFVKNPNDIGKLLKKYLKTNPSDMDASSARRMGYRHLYNLFGVKDKDKALEYFQRSFDLSKDVSCSNTCMGRFFEVVKRDYSKAFGFYQDAYKCYLTNQKANCDCGAASLANAYINGIGTPKDLKKAKEIILDVIDKSEIVPCNVSVYLYTYFYLLGDERFKLDKCYEMLKVDYSYERYEVVRFMYLLIMEKHLNLDSTLTLKKLKKSLKYASFELKQYYQENKNNDLLYPFYTSF